jgi:hypothetical protein
LPGFLRTPITVDDARRRLREQLARREETFLVLVDRVVYGTGESPYRPLLDAAGLERGDVRRLVAEHGLEVALGRLFDAGVRVTLDEFKGRVPIERPGLSIPTTAEQFDNPLLARHYRAATGGSRGARRRVSVDLDLLEHETTGQILLRQAFHATGRPFAVWRPVLPSSSGLNNCLRQAKLGEPVAAWFNPYREPRTLEALSYRVFTASTIAASRVVGARIAGPDLCLAAEAARVARWLAQRRAEGRPAVLDTQAALAVRTCAAAQDRGLDIAGSLFGVGGEPYTREKDAVVTAAGCRAYCTYAMTETGRIGLGCGEGTRHDDMHVLTEKLAVLQRDRAVGPGQTVGALHYTALLPSAPKIMINVESDDYGVLEERACGCPLGEVGLTTHVHDIRSYEKLTAEGNHFLGSDLVDLVERVLPARFGGTPTDYQLVEEEVDGLPRVSIVARPSLGPLDEREVVAAAIAHLGEAPRNRLMADAWRSGGTLRLVRREPVTSPGGKIFPLQLAPPA